MKKYQIIKLDLFPYDIMIAYDVLVDDIKSRLNEKYDIKIDDDGEKLLRGSRLAHTLKLRNNAVLIYFPAKPTNGIIAHEVFHAVWMILATMGVAPSVDSEEVYAYMLEYIISKIV